MIKHAFSIGLILFAAMSSPVEAADFSTASTVRLPPHMIPSGGKTILKGAAAVVATKGVGKFLKTGIAGKTAITLGAVTSGGYYIRSLKREEDRNAWANTEISRSAADASRPNGKKCPAPTKKLRNMSKLSAAYQFYVTGSPLTPNLPLETVFKEKSKKTMLWNVSEFNINGVMFDGCRESDGVLLEAKADYSFAFIGDTLERVGWINDGDLYLNEARRQVNAAEHGDELMPDGRFIEWHFMQKRTCDHAKSTLSKEKGIERIHIVCDNLFQ